MKTPVRISALLLLVAAASAQAQPDVKEILKKVQETYKNVTQYELAMAFSQLDPRTKQEVSGSARYQFKGPDKYRVETNELLTVYDGSSLWIYNATSNEYRTYKAPNLPRGTTPDAFDRQAGIAPFRSAETALGPVRFLREESISAGGGTADCYVLGGAPPNTTALWIDKKSYRVLKLRDIGGPGDTVFQTVQLGGRLSDDLFKFTPPAGARKLE